MSKACFYTYMLCFLHEVYMDDVCYHNFNLLINYQNINILVYVLKMPKSVRHIRSNDI